MTLRSTVHIDPHRTAVVHDLCPTYAHMDRATKYKNAGRSKRHGSMRSGLKPAYKCVYLVYVTNATRDVPYRRVQSLLSACEAANGNATES